MPKSSAIWFVVAAGILFVGVLKGIVRTKTNARRLDLGAVSDQWMADHCLGSDGYIRR